MKIIYRLSIALLFIGVYALTLLVLGGKVPFFGLAEALNGTTKTTQATETPSGPPDTDPADPDEGNTGKPEDPYYPENPEYPAVTAPELRSVTIRSDGYDSTAAVVYLDSYMTVDDIMKMMPYVSWSWDFSIIFYGDLYGAPTYTLFNSSMEELYSGETALTKPEAEDMYYVCVSVDWGNSNYAECYQHYFAVYVSAESYDLPGSIDDGGSDGNGSVGIITPDLPVVEPGVPGKR